MKKFKIIYKFGKSYGQTSFEVREHANSYDEIVQTAIIRTIEQKEKYFKISPNERDVKSKKTITIIETDIESGFHIKNGIKLRVPWC